MFFKNRLAAGQQLCPFLARYKDEDSIVYAIPRGGVIVAEPIAKFLNAPMDLLLAHKIGHPTQPEYAIAAVSESGLLIGNAHELSSVNQEWLQNAKKQQMQEIKRKREKYFQERGEIPLKGKIAIIVDDGIATGLTMQVGIKELKERHPKKIVVAVPVAPQSTASVIKTMANDFVAIVIPENYQFLGSVGSYYEEFDQVEDEEVIEILNTYANSFIKEKK